LLSLWAIILKKNQQLSSTSPISFFRQINEETPTEYEMVTFERERAASDIVQLGRAGIIQYGMREVV
jgi:hypothetical protein